MPQVVFRCLGVVNVFPLHGHFSADSNRLIFPIARVAAWLVFDVKRLQLATAIHLLLDVRDEAIKQSVVVVLRLVHDARRGFDGNCLVTKASHFDERLGLRQLDVGCDRNLEVVAVIFFDDDVGLFIEARPVLSFLASDPRPPRRRTAGAVSQRAAQTEKLPDNALRFCVIDDGRCSAGANGHAFACVVEHFSTHFRRQFLFFSPRPDFFRAKFVIANDRGQPIRHVERCHSIGSARYD